LLVLSASQVYSKDSTSTASAGSPVEPVALVTRTDDCFNLLDYVPQAFSYHLLEISPDISMTGRADSHRRTSEYNYTSGSQLERDQSFQRNVNSNPTTEFRTNYLFNGWNGKTEWNINSSIEGSGSLILRPERSRRTDQDNLTEDENRSYSESRERNGSGSAGFSVSAAHYFRWPFFIGVMVSPAAVGEVERQADISKSYTPVTRVLYDTILQDTGRYDYSDSERRGRNYRVSGRANIRIGGGHIENVTFAVVAMNMLDRIAENESSSKGCSARNVQMLAGLIEKNADAVYWIPASVLLKMSIPCVRLLQKSA
jgi:hypothetical protein